jgi:hypothetical protein
VTPEAARGMKRCLVTSEIHLLKFGKIIYQNDGTVKIGRIDRFELQKQLPENARSNHVLVSLRFYSVNCFREFVSLVVIVIYFFVCIGSEIDKSPSDQTRTYILIGGIISGSFVCFPLPASTGDRVIHSSAQDYLLD